MDGILIVRIVIDGFTYERQSLLDHFARNGHVDPITGRPCKESDLVPNRSLKEAIEDFLKDNGWAAGKAGEYKIDTRKLIALNFLVDY